MNESVSDSGTEKDAAAPAAPPEDADVPMVADPPTIVGTGEDGEPGRRHRGWHGPRRIRDTGEVTRRERKEAAVWGLEAGITSDDGKLRTLAETWPPPRWVRAAAVREKRERPAAELAFVRALRDELRVGKNLKAEIELGKEKRGVREIALRVLQGDTSVRDAMAELQKVASARPQVVALRTILYTQLGHHHDFGRYVFSRRDDKGWDILTGAGGEKIAGGATIEKAATELGRAIAKGADEAGDDPRLRYELRKRLLKGAFEYGIYRKHASQWVRVRVVADAAAGRDAIEKDIGALEDWWRRWRTVPAHRPPGNEPREPRGNEHLSEPEDVMQHFGVRGIQFGNWLDGTARLSDLARASQGLADLARVLEWSTGGLGLGSRLGVAFGARGTGGRNPLGKTVYDPVARLLIFSKAPLPGSLAHAWFRALDHETARRTGRGQRAWATVGPAPRRRPGDERDPMVELGRALANCGAAVHTGPLRTRAAGLDRRRPRTKPYWSTVPELAARAFEQWVIARLAAEGIRNDYLANIVGPDEWDGEPEIDQGYPYALDDEMPALDQVFRQLAETGAGAAALWADEADEAAAARLENA